jgi:aspartate-semialdehyde dehydrogenase
LAEVALVGSDSLIGREIRDLLRDQPVEIKLIAGEEEEAGALTEQSGEAAIVGEINPDSLADARVLFLAGSPASSQKALDLAVSAAKIDLTYAAEDRPSARLRAPMVEPEDYAAPNSDALQVIAHPAAIAIALVLGRLHAAHPVRRSVAHVFEPASERGARALDELRQQTISLLSFKGLPKTVFDAQLSFNILARYGAEAPVALEEAEMRIERHLASLLAASGRAPMPSLRLIQAPVFHGHTFSLWVQFEANPGPAAIEQALSAEPIDLRAGDLEPPNIAGIANQSGVAVGAINTDRNDPRACWVWLVCDNLRIAAENAVAVARQLL